MASTHHGLLVHVVFATKLRYPLIGDSWRDDLFGYIGRLVKDHQAILLKAGGVEDHVHLLLKTHPARALAETVKLLKCNSSRWANRERKVDCRFEWQRGYGAFSVSESMAETVKRYLANQKAHHQTQSFRDEYVEILRRHRIEFDERYVFDEEIAS